MLQAYLLVANFPKPIYHARIILSNVGTVVLLLYPECHTVGAHRWVPAEAIRRIPTRRIPCLHGEGSKYAGTASAVRARNPYRSARAFSNPTERFASKDIGSDSR